MTVTSFTELEVFSCLSFNILNEDLSGKVDKISSIIFKYTVPSTIELGLISPAEEYCIYTK